MDTPVKLVIVGGGFGGIEAALYARRRLGAQVEVTLVSDRATFRYKPYLIYVPFGLRAEELELDLKTLAEAHGFRFRQGRAHALDPARKRLYVGQTSLAYDALVLATGGSAAADETPGLAQHAYAIGPPRDLERLQGAFGRLVRDLRAGKSRRIVFLDTPASGWTGPLYELAFMLERWLQWKEARADAKLLVATPEATHLPVLGPPVHEAIVQELSERGIETRMEATIRRVGAGSLFFEDGESAPYDLLVAVPPQRAAVAWRSLPTTERGFLRVEPATRQVEGHPSHYAVGDGAAGPLSMAFSALLQADAAMEHLAARVLGEEPTFAFRSEGRWLMEQFDQAVLAKGTAEREGAVERLPVGQFRRLLIRKHLPGKAGAHNPLYLGLFWKGTTVGVKMLRQLLREAG